MTKTIEPERCPNPLCRSNNKNIRGDGTGFPCADPWHDSEQRAVMTPEEREPKRKIYKYPYAPKVCPECDGDQFITSGGYSLMCIVCWLTEENDKLSGQLEQARKELALIKAKLADYVGEDCPGEMKANHVGAPAVFALEQACREICNAFDGYGCYLVGSSIERANWGIKSLDSPMSQEDDCPSGGAR